MSTATQPQQSAAPAANGKDKSLLQDILDRPIVYKPFMGESEVTLSARTVLKFLVKPTRSGKLPSPEDAIKFAKLCEARGLNPWEGDAFLVGYDTQDGPEFNLITAHQAFLKRAEVHPEFDGMEAGITIESEGEVFDRQGDYVGDGEKLVAGWARVHFKTRKIPCYQRIKLSTFDTGRSRWKKDPAGMISKVAEAHALRTAFPTRLGGMYLRDEIASIEATESGTVISDQNRTKVRPSSLNQAPTAPESQRANGGHAPSDGEGHQTAPPDAGDDLPMFDPPDESGNQYAASDDFNFSDQGLAFNERLEDAKLTANHNLMLKQEILAAKGKLSPEEYAYLAKKCDGNIERLKK